MCRLAFVAVLTFVLSGCALSPLRPREGESEVTVRVLGADGKVPGVVHVFVGSHGERVRKGTFKTGIPKGGVRLLRVMSPLHHAVTLPLQDTGGAQHVEVKLGTPPLPDAIHDPHVLFRDGRGMKMSPSSDGRFIAMVPVDMLNAGIQLGGVAVGGPVSVAGASSYVPTPEGTYWSEFNHDPRAGAAMISFSAAALRYDAAQPVVTFSERSAGSLYEVIRWGERQRTQVLTGLHEDMIGAMLGRPQSGERGDANAQLEEAARFLSEMVDGSRGAERDLWQLTALALLVTPEHQVQARDYAQALAGSLAAGSELWSAYPRVTARFGELAWRCCADAVRALAVHPDEAVAREALQVTVMRAEDAEAREALSRFEKLHPDAVDLETARRFLGGLRPGQRPPDFRIETADGERVRLRQFQGSHVLICFWTTTTKGLDGLFPMLLKLEQEHAPRGLRILNVSLNQDGETYRRFVAASGEGLPGVQARAHATDHEAIATAYGLLTLPSLVLIGPDGRVAATNAELLRDGLGPTIEEALNPPQR